MSDDQSIDESGQVDATPGRQSAIARIAPIPLMVAGALLILLGAGIDFVTGTNNGLGKGQILMIASGVILIVATRKIPAGLLLRCYLLSVSLFLGAALVEIACRVVLPVPAIGMTMSAGVPSSQSNLVSEPDQFEAVHSYNKYGFRGPDFELTPTRSRIVCLGDSFTEGIGATDNTNWPAVLQRQLGNWDVINLGASGSAPDRYLRFLNEVGIALSPDYVIVCLIPSDLIDGPQIPTDVVPRKELHDVFRNRESRLASAMAIYLPGWTCLIDGFQGRLTPPRPNFWKPWNQDRQDLIWQEIARRTQVDEAEAKSIAGERLGQIDAGCMEAANRGSFNSARIAAEVVRPYGSFQCTTADMGIPVEELEEQTQRWMRAFADTCRGASIEPIVVFFPESGLVSDDPNGPVSDESLAGRPSVSQDDSVSELLQDACQMSGVTFVSCAEVLRAYQGEEPLFLRYDGHPTQASYQIVASHIAAELKREIGIQ